VTFSLLCDFPSRYCIEYSNGTLHDVLTFELIVVLSAFAAIFGYMRAHVLYRDEQEEQGGNNEISSIGGSIPSLGNEENNGGHGSIRENLIDSEASPPRDAT
jgi:hypothetical protein